MTTTLTLQREFLSPPGEDILEAIEAIGMTQQELADRMGRKKNEINELIHGKRPLTLETARQLERVLGVPVDYWTERERQYRIELAKVEEAEELEANLDWAKRFPLKKMISLGWIKKHADKAEQVKALIQYFAVANPDQWESMYADGKQAAAFRISLANVHEPEAVSAWLRHGERDLDAMDLPEFDKKAFGNALQEIRNSLVLHQPEDFASKLQEMCRTVGVAVVYTPCLPKAPINGVARWVHGKPLIQLSDRYKSADIFWFSFFHEAGHILLHGKKGIFLEGLKNAPFDEQKEAEADRFASDLLIDPNLYGALDKLVINEFTIPQLANKAGTHPGILVGRLQKEGFVKHSYCNQFKVKVSLFD